MPCLVLPVGKLWMEWHTEGQGSGSSAEAVPQMWLRGGPLKEPNPQAVEAQAARIYERDPYPNRPMWPECPADCTPYFRRLATEDLSIAEPHIRSQLLTELAEWFDEMREEKHYIGYGAAADRIRELAAKEKP